MSVSRSTEKRAPLRFDRIWLVRLAALALGLSLLSLLALAAMLRRDIPLAELRAQYAPLPSRFTQIEGMSVHYRDEGQGHPIVLLHGASSSLHTWDGWADALKTHRRVVRLDLPGFGLTGPAADRDYRPRRLARVVGKLLDKLAIEQADFAGNSLGGRVAITFALDSPRRVRRLILLDVAGMSGQKPPAIFRVAKSALGPWLIRWITPRFLVRANVEQVYGDKSRVSEALVDRYVAMTLRAGNRQATLDRVNGPQSPPLDARLPELRLPTLLQWGERDQWIPVTFAHRMHSAIKGSELIVYPNAGHLPMEELPFVSVRDADAFLEATDDEPSVLDVLEDDAEPPLD
jgi:pimeloyl-ACP methyl ester carboxylesterase